MESEGSVSILISHLKAGGQHGEEAAQELWERYHSALLALALQHLRNGPRRVADEEDVVLVAFDRFFRAVAEKRLTRLSDRDDLWRLLLTLVERTASNQRRDAKRQKRGGGAVRGESALDCPQGGSGEGRGLEQVPDPRPTPEFAALVADSLDGLLGRLQDERLREVVLLKLEGYSAKEISARLGCAVPTVERRCRRIREIWQQEEGHGGPTPGS